MTNDVVSTPRVAEEQILEDLYQRLGVAPNASKDQIKKAYRALAAFYHPDKETGNRVMFDAIKDAYDILMDDEKRAQYDESGVVEKPSIDDPVEVEAREQCGMILSNIISEEPNPDQVNVLLKMQGVFQHMFKQLDERRHQLDDRERRTRSLRKRLKRAKKKVGRSALLLMMLDHHIKAVAEARIKLTHDRKVVERVKEIFEEYAYEVDEVDSFDMFRSRMRGPNEPQFFHMGRNFRGDSTGS